LRPTIEAFMRRASEMPTADGGEVAMQRQHCDDVPGALRPALEGCLALTQLYVQLVLSKTSQDVEF
jgi:hypothetical protein